MKTITTTQTLPRNALARPFSCAQATLFIAATALLLAVTARAAGPSSELFLTLDPTTGASRLLGITGTNTTFNVLQSAGGGQSPIAVNSTIRTLGFGGGSGNTGAEYTLAGVATGNTYAFPAALGTDEVDDGTTNGTFNYGWDVTNGIAYQFSLTWTSPIALFTLGTASGHYLGITYDASNNSLWVAGLDGAVGTLISNYSLTGTLLSSFSIGHNFSGSLALDPADGTLWLSNLITPNLTLEQYARSATGSFGGTQTALDSQTYAGLSAGAFGGEFQYTGTVVPEPSTWAMLLGGSLLVAISSARRSINRNA